METKWKYQTDRVALIPYTTELAVAYDGLLGHLYLRTKQDDLLDTVFCGLPHMNFDKFVSYLAKPTTALQIYYTRTEPMIPAGYCFLYEIDGEPGQRLAQLGFCFFKEYWARPDTREWGWLCLEYWFKELGVDVLYGATRADNFLARNFCRRYGFQEIGIAPKFLRSAKGRTDARLVMLEKETFRFRLAQKQARQMAA